MKKIILSLVIAVSCAAAFANDNNDVKVTGAVLSSFKSDFRYTDNVSWKQLGNYYIATFTQFDGNYQAFYTYQGKLAGFLTAIGAHELPALIQKSVNRKFASVQTKSVSRFYTPGEGFSYYINVDHKNQNRIIHVDPMGNIEIVKRNK